MEYDKRFSSFYLRCPTRSVVLLLHGFTGSPLYFLPFAKKLYSHGYSVFAKQLAGHGQTPETLSQTTFQDWRQSACDALLHLRNRYERIFMVGHSLGGALALDLSGQFPERIQGVVTVGAPYVIRYHTFHRSLLPFLRRVKKFHQKNGISIGNYFESTGSYEVFPLQSLKELYAYVNQVFRPRLPDCKVPVCIIQPGKDKLVRLNSGKKIFEHLGSQKKHLVFFANMAHNPFLSQVDQEEVLHQTLAWFDQTTEEVPQDSLSRRFTDVESRAYSQHSSEEICPKKVAL